jgi:general stress protein 26
MDSINKRQSEDHKKDVHGIDAVVRIREVIGKTQTCFFCTSAGTSAATRPMNVRQVDDKGHLWFLSANDSHKNAEIAMDPAVTLYFQGSEHSDFLQLKGHANISVDKRKIKELWEPMIKTWFTGGVEVSPVEGYYWDNKHGNAIAGLKMLLGAALGKTMDDSIEGRVQP